MCGVVRVYVRTQVVRQMSPGKMLHKRNYLRTGT